MAATGKTPILLYGSTTPTNQPSAGNLTNSSDGCEIAINVADKNLFFKDSTNAVNTVPIRQSSGSSDGWLSSTDWTTFNNKGSGTVTSVTGTSPVASSGGTTPAISLSSGYGDTQNPYASKTQNYFLAAPNGSSGAPTFRAIVAADIPTLNQNTSGTAAGLSATLAVTSGGTGTATAFTAGSIVFAGASGVYSQKNANLFWDNTNNRIGLNTASPAYGLDLQNVGGSAAIARVYGNDQSNVRLRIENSGGQAYELVGGNPGASNSGLAIYDATSSATRIYLSSTGGVSIGNTTDPGATNLSVTGTVTGATHLTNTAASMGYTTGAGGTVTQATNKTTSVTLNKPCGQITMNNAALAAGAQVRFFVGNSTVGLYDVVSISLKDGFSDSAYNIWTSVANGAFYVNVKNISAGSLSEAIVLNFVVIKSAIS